MKTPLLLIVLLTAFTLPSLAAEVLTSDTNENGKFDPWQYFLDSHTVERVEYETNTGDAVRLTQTQ